MQVAAIVLSIAVTLVAVTLLVRTVRLMIAQFAVGQPVKRSDAPAERTKTLVREFLGHTRMAKLPWVAFAHWNVMLAFGVLFLTLVTAYGQLFNPQFTLPLIGSFVLYEWVTEVFAWTGLLGIIFLIIRRQVNNPGRAKGMPRMRQGKEGSRFYGSTAWEAYFVEGVILSVALAITTLRVAEYSLYQAVGDSHGSVLHFPLTAWLSPTMSSLSVSGLETLIIVVAALKIIISMTWMIVIARTPTMGVAWHRFLAFFNIWFKRHADGRTSLGAVEPISVGGEKLDFEKVDELDEDAPLGVGAVENFTWKGLLDFSTCTECGRCQSQCPAWNTEKPLSPKLLITSLRDHAHAKAPWMMASDEVKALGAEGPLSSLAVAESEKSLIGDVITEDVLWSCTTCGACVEQCPVDIEHVDHIVDMRRNQVLLESAFPGELAGLFKNLERKQNPWGMSQRKRLAWAKDLEFEVPQIGADVEDASEVDYLFWVGCAGAFEDRAKKTSAAVAELLHMAGVKYAVLGDGESCTGDSARRAGNEFLFHTLAQTNVEVMNELKVTKVVVTCAHCFNTIKNEYPQLGGNYEVVHHTQLLNRLVRDGKLTPVAAPDGPTSGVGLSAAGATAPSVTYHDPCYLGRHNDVYSPPRELIGSLPGVTMKEMPRHGKTSFCCGAGGARMWMEEKIGSRINTNRVEEALDTGADAIAIGCPFCRVMLSDGLTALQGSGDAREEVQVVDVAQMLLAAVKRGEATKESPEDAPAGS